MTNSTPPRAPSKTALLRRLHCKRSSPLLPTLLPTRPPARTNIPELYPPTSQHDAPAIPTTIRISVIPQLHPLPRPARCRTRFAPADGMRRPHTREGRC
jgi:hypothetical protein